MSKKNKIIIGVSSGVLALVIALTAIFVNVKRQNEIKREQEEYEQVQNATHTPDETEPSESTSDDNQILDIIVPDDDGSGNKKDDIILDVSDKNRDPNPGIIDATIEYATKESEENDAE